MRSRSVALTTTTVLLTLLLASSVATASPASSQVDGTRGGPVELGAVNIIRATSSGYVEVTLPQRATIAATEKGQPDAAINADITVRGPGRFAGIALIEDPYPGVRDPHRFFLAGRFGGCDDEGCKPTRQMTETMFDLQQQERPTLSLEPGDYRLYVFADGKPVEAVFRLHGLTGTRTFTPDENAAFDLQTSPTRVDAEPDGGRIWSAGSSFEGGQVGFSMSVLTVEAKDLEGTELGVCQYDALGAPPEAVAYGPHCSSTSGVLGPGAEVTFDSDVDSDSFTLMTTFGYHDNQDGTFGIPNLTGDYGLGAWVKSTHKVDVAPFRSFFLAIR